MVIFYMNFVFLEEEESVPFIFSGEVRQPYTRYRVLKEVSYGIMHVELKHKERELKRKGVE